MGMQQFVMITKHLCCGRLGRSLCLAAMLLLSFCGAMQAIAADLDAEVAEVCAAAKRAREAKNFETVERKRRERWNLIVAAADDPAHAKSPWVVGYKAIRDVDGDAFLTAEELPDPGLLNRMDYKTACQRLRQALDAIRQTGNGPFLGEVATRLFEVTQQARACYRNALGDDSSDSVATVAEVEAALRAAEERDPCCLMATPMRLFIKAPDPKDAFLRAELRDDFKTRQRKLVELSHRVLFFSPTESPTAEHADDPLLPWHAAVELCKAQSLGYILEELDHASYLTPEQRGPSYSLPGKVVAGRDAFSDPFVLLYGRYLIARVVDEQGKLRTAQLFLNDKNEWDHQFLDLLWRRPKSESRTPFERLIEQLPVRAIFTLQDEEFSIREFPAEATETLLSQQVQLFCVKDASQFEKLTFVIGANNPQSVLRLASPRSKIGSDATTPQVTKRLEDFARKGDRTKHPLIELMKDDPEPAGEQALNPLVLVSVNDQAECKPAFLLDDAGNPYLNLDDGARLYFDSAADSDRAPCFYVEYPGATAVMPLRLTSVPLNLLEAGRMGSAFKELLLDSGYSETDADAELRKCMEKPTYVPPKFDRLWKMRVKSTGQPQNLTIQAMLQEKGWSGPTLLPREVTRLYDQYGFRYLKDRRGNWITSSRFSQDQGTPTQGQGDSLPPDVEADIMQYPFDFRAQDGKQRIDRRQVYAWKDYQQLKENISREHLAKLIRFHPCFPVWDSVMQDAMHKLENPSESQPDYSANGEFENRFSALLTRARQTGLLDLRKLESPCGAWAQPNDKHQRATLDNLHNEYVMRINAAAEGSQVLEALVILYAWLNSLEESVPGLTKSAADLRKQLDQAFNSARERWVTSVQPVFALQLESARDFAAQKYFHRAMVHYNDLLLQQYGTRYQQEGQEILRGVATTEEAEKYAKAFGSHVEAERLALVAQLELAGVLNAAGLKDSAYAIWQRLADEYRYVVKPMVDIAEDTVMAYGLRFSDRATESLRVFDDIAMRAEAAIEKYKLAPQWRVIVNADGPAKQRSGLLVAEVETLSRKEQSGEPLAPQELRALEAAMRSIGSQGLPDLALWLQYRQALLPRLSLATRPLREYRLHPIQFCPQSYSSERGFERSIGDLLSRADIDAIRRWCQLDQQAALQSPLAPEACFLIGWYWLDAGQSSRARAAFMGMVEAFQSQAASAAGKQESLIARLNAMSGVVGAMSIAENVPGLAMSKGDFGIFLLGQVLRWEREWFGAALYGPHASAAGRVLERQVDYVRNRLLVVDAAWRSERYYFPDYTYVFGAVPDWVAKKAIFTPELFDSALTKEDVADKKGRAAEELGWVLLTPDHARHFFQNLEVDLTVKQDIVDLAK